MGILICLIKRIYSKFLFVFEIGRWKGKVDIFIEFIEYCFNSVIFRKRKRECLFVFYGYYRYNEFLERI